MKKILVTLAFAFSALVVIAQDEFRVESKLTEATVFLNKAQLKRQVSAKVNAGRSSLVITGLTSMLDQKSIQVSGKGKIIIEGITVRQHFINEFNLPAKLKSLRDSADLLQRLILLEQSQKEILLKEEQLLNSNQKIGGTQSNITVAELKSMADFYRARSSEIVFNRMKHDEKIKQLNERLGKVQRQLAEQNDLFSRNTSEIVVTVSAQAPTTAQLEVEYLVANAGWTPVYDLRASTTNSPIQLNYKANLFQNTGEEWKEVKLTLSTANPNESGLKPELKPWLLDFYVPIVYNRGREINLERKDSKAAMDMMAEAPAMEEVANVATYVSTTQTTLTTEFAIALPYTVTSGNKPTLVDIAQHEMKAVYMYSVAPKLDDNAFLLAKAIGWEAFNLLPGEANIFFEGTFVSNTFLDPNNIKDTLSVSLGRDKRVVVKRDKLKDFSSRKAIGANQRDSYAFEISVRNTKNEAIKISVEDQIPVSATSQIEVSSTDIGGALYSKDTGKLSWLLNIQPNETKNVRFSYEVKYPKDKRISGLE